MLAVSAVAAWSAWLMISYQLSRHLPVPIGVDTPSHLWRTRVVHSLGLQGLFGSSPFEYNANTANPDRLGLPVIGSLLGPVANVGPWRLMFVASGLAAAVLAFSAWALARAVAEPRWAAPIYAAAVAMSLPFAITARSHLDNVLVDGLLVAAAAVLIRLARAERGIVAAVMLATGAVLMHWPIGLIFVAVGGLYALSLLPVSIAALRTGTAWTATPTARIGLVAAVSGGLGLGALVLTPGAHLFSTSDRESFAGNVNRTLHWYRLPFTLSLAGLGAVMMWFPSPRSPRRRALLLYLAWSTPIVLGALLFAWGRALPVMRLLGVAFPIALLCAAAGAGLIRVGASIRGAGGRIVGGVAVATVVAVIALQAHTARQSFEGTQPMARATEIEPIRTAISYLTSSAPGRQVVFAVQDADHPDGDFGIVPSFRRIRAFAPGWEAPEIASYLGDPDRLLAGGATRRPGAASFNEASDIYWGLLARWLDDDAVVMVLRPFHDGYRALRRANPDAEIAPGVMLLRGPPPAPSFASPAPLMPPTSGQLIGWIAASFAALVLAGAGWSWGLLRLPWSDRIAFAPAFGLAALVLGGSAAAYGGVLVGGAGGRWVFAGVALAGWVVALSGPAWARVRRGRAADATRNEAT